MTNINTYTDKHLYEVAFWSRTHQNEGKGAFLTPSCTEGIKRKYLDTLVIGEDYFKDKIVVDIGCGPRGSLHCFEAREKIGLDPLSNIYIRLFGIHKHDMKYMSENIENTTIPSDSVDIVISVNSLDHVDSLLIAISNIRRILKEGGEFRVNFNLQPHPTPTEPISMSKNKIIHVLKDYFEKVTVLKEFPITETIPHERIAISCIK